VVVFRTVILTILASDGYSDRADSEAPAARMTPAGAGGGERVGQIRDTRINSRIFGTEFVIIHIDKNYF
jgi:hypothetical protein